MKLLITSLFLTIALFAKAQIVNIPDSSFKAALLSRGIDINGDGEIQTSEASIITSLSISINNITDITGIRFFTALRHLELGSPNITFIDLDGMNNLKYLSIMGIDSLRSINLNDCSGIDTFWCSDNGALLTSLDVRDCINLKLFDCGSYNINDLKLGVLDSLYDFSTHGLLLDTLDLRNCKNLRYFSCRNPRYRVVNLSDLTNLSYAGFSGSFNDSLNDFILTNCSNLISFSPGGIQRIKSVDVTGCTKLQNFQIGDPSLITSLDFSTCTNLKNLYLHAEGLKFLNLKNGTVLTTFGYSDWYLSDTKNICVDEFELADVSQVFSSLSGQVNVTSFCTFFPGGSYNTIKGKVKIDANNNGCDSTDRTMQQVAVKIQDTSGNSLIRYTAPSGDYAHYAYKGSFTLTPYFPYSYFAVNPAAASASFDTANNLTIVRDFCITPTSVHNDLEISFLPTFPPARPGFNAAYTLLYKNRGTTTLSGNVAVNFDNNKMNFISASENVTTQSSGQLLWNYSNLLPFESRTINVTFNLLPPPVNNIGDTINYLAVVTPSDNDETAFDNIFILPQTVIGSFDPNDKQCIEGSKLDISKIGDYLHYQIRFQNEGTDTAFNIVVADTLSTNLDWSTFEYIGSSHTADVKLTNNKLEFFYPNINLPYKAIDEPGSNGWVAFKIKPKPSVVIGDSLNNRAAIYFDFNLPVITNTATTIVSSAATPVPVKLEYFSVNKKDNSNQLNWKASCTYGNAAFAIERSDDGIHFKSIGNITATALRCQLPFNFMDNNPVVGKNYYRLKISDADGKSFYSKTLVVGNGKAGVEITAVVNNNVYLYCNKQQTVTIKVIAADGTVLANQKQPLAAGNSNFVLPVVPNAKGIYTLIVFTNNGEIITKRFVK